MNRTTAASTLSLLALHLLAGCEAWPRYAHLPTEPVQGVPPGTDPADAVEVAWAAPVREQDPGNETPPEALSVGLGEGVVIYGALDGAGWDPTQLPPHEVSCEGLTETTDYPPLSQGAYAADEDWVSLTPTADGALCVVMEIELPEELGDELFYDMLLYDLDTCMNPTTAYADADDALLGLGLYATSADYSAEVTTGASLSVLIAGVLAAEVSDVQTPWRLGLALLEPDEAGGAVVCPNLPEAP